MKILDVIRQSADLLGLDTERDLLSEAEESDETSLLENAKIAQLFNLLKFSIQELCANHLFYYVYQDFTTSNKKFSLSTLTNYLKTDAVYRGENKVKFRIFNRHLLLNEDGNYTIKYSSYPSINSIFDDVDFVTSISIDVMVYGLCAYYCLANGMFEDFDSYYDKYISKANALKEMKIFDLPTRSWQ